MGKIIVSKYSPKWRSEFSKAKTFLCDLLREIECRVVHIGSTSVKGLWAKPILDIDIIVGDSHVCDLAIERLKTVGYVHLGDLGIEGREAFSYSKDNPQIKWMDHHLYVCLAGSTNLNNHLLLRQHLRSNKKAVAVYSKLKVQLAKEFPHDIDAYVEGKSELIASFLAVEGMGEEAIAQIGVINRKK